MIRASPLTVAPNMNHRHRPSAPRQWWGSRRRCRRSAHIVLLLGPPGAGKSMLARRLTTILPAMTLAEAIETTRIHRVAGLTGDRTALVTTRPFRAPHHTISDVGLIGGGDVPMPGEVSLGHHGVRCLDHGRSAAATSGRSGDNRSRRVSYEYNFADVLDLHMLTTLAAWTVTTKDVRRTP